jgi:hypothetical protein
MTARHHGPHPSRDADEGRPAFADLLAQAMTGADRFGHRQHVHLTWLAVRPYSTRSC